MVTSQLPERASLEYLKKMAKERLAQMRRDDPKAKLAAALLDIAREYGFSSWRALKEEIDRRREHAVSLFFDACVGGDLDTVRAMLAAEPALVSMADPKGQYRGWTGLHYVARHGQLEVARLLLAHGADPNAREAGDNTCPLHWAAADRNIEIVRALLDAGGDVEGAGDLHELDAIGWATYFHPPGGRIGERPEVAQLLVERGTRHHVYSAMSLGDFDLLRSVVEEDPGALDRRMSRFENRLTALHFALKRRRHDMLDLLIELGADLEATDGDGHTALEAAMLVGDTESVRRLEAAGAIAPQPRNLDAANLAEFAKEVRRITPMLRVPDVGRAVAWYVSLGFREQSRYEEGGVLYWASLSFGAAELMLNLGEAPDNPSVTLWFYVERVAVMYDVLKSRQLQAATAQDANGNFVEFIEQLHEPFYGGRQFSIRDPNGFSLAFLGPA